MDKVIKLLEYFKKYQEKGMGADLARFGMWLNKEINGERIVEVPVEYQLSDDVTIGFLMGRLLGYGDVWTRMAFRDLPIQHFYDYGILKHTEQAKNPTKKEIADQSLLEQSTCFEAIKRLVKHKVLTEETDMDDRRVKRVRLTSFGKKVTEVATQQAFRLSNLLVGDLTDKEKKDLIRILRKLDHFHEDLYRKVERNRIIENYNL